MLLSGDDAVYVLLYEWRALSGFARDEMVRLRDRYEAFWDGMLYDCDFNQMLDLPVQHDAPAHIRDFAPARLHHRQITTRNHCYGCTAGAGSSCGGTVT